MTEPVRGDRFRVPGRAELLVVDVVELTVTDEPGHPTVWFVRTAAGARWALRIRETADDEVRYHGRPLPADPAAPPV